MTTAPFVELGFNPTDLRPRDLPRAGAFLGSPAEAIEAALAVARAQMVDRMRMELRGIAQPTHGQLLRIADLAWQSMFWRFRKVSAPVLADAYMRAYRRADAGDVPTSVIYDLADKHAEKIGDYFHSTSREGLAEGFSTLVNRRVPAKAASDRVLDAYGLTPRQMRAYTASKQFDTPVSDVMPRSLKAKARSYIDKAFTSRTRKLSAQEEHNVEQQAQQFAWMWLQDKGRLSDQAEKMWLTARDERVCPVCGPLHGKKVGVNEQFKTSHGEFWTPGVHPNCRCVVRLLENQFQVSKAWDPREHPRGGDPENRGRFSVKVRTKPYKEMEPTEAFQSFLDRAEAIEEEQKEEPLLPVIPSPLITPTMRTRAPAIQTTPAISTTPLITPVAQEPLLGTPEQAPLIPAATRSLGLKAAEAKPVVPFPNLAPVSGKTWLHQGDHREFYAVRTVHDADVPHDWDYQLTGVRFYDSLGQAKWEAAEKRKRMKWDAIARLTGRDSARSITTRDPHSNEELFAYIEEVDIEDMVEHIAGPDHGNEESGVEVIWYDSMGEVRDPEGWISYDEMAEQFQLSHDDFDVYILGTSEAHDDEDLTHWIGEDQYRLSGSYVVTDKSTVPDNDGYEVVVRHLRPYIPKRHE